MVDSSSTVWYAEPGNDYDAVTGRTGNDSSDSPSGAECSGRPWAALAVDSLPGG